MAKAMKFNRQMLQKALNKKRFAWVDSVMKEELPTDIYGSMHSPKISERLRATNWMNEKGYHIRDAGEGVIQIFRGTTLVRQTKLILELNDPEELLSVAEAVTENVNIPPPPWAR